LACGAQAQGEHPARQARRWAEGVRGASAQRLCGIGDAACAPRTLLACPAERVGGESGHTSLARAGHRVGLPFPGAGGTSRCRPTAGETTPELAGHAIRAAARNPPVILKVRWGANLAPQRRCDPLSDANRGARPLLSAAAKGWQRAMVVSQASGPRWRDIAAIGRQWACRGSAMHPLALQLANRKCITSPSLTA